MNLPEWKNKIKEIPALYEGLLDSAIDDWRTSEEKHYIEVEELHNKILLLSGQLAIANNICDQYKNDKAELIDALRNDHIELVVANPDMTINYAVKEHMENNSTCPVCQLIKRMKSNG